MLAVAHRGGNELDAMLEAATAGAHVVEADVHLHRGRLEIRHQKAMGPLPWFWEKWRLYPADFPRPLLDELLAARPPGTTLMLDLKGVGRVGARTRQAITPQPGAGPLLVCARWWPSVRPFLDSPDVKVLLSARGRVELFRLRRRLGAGKAPYGVSVHLSMLTPEVVSEIQRYGVLVLTWPVDDDASLAEALRVGVDGVITKDLATLRTVVASH